MTSSRSSIFSFDTLRLASWRVPKGGLAAVAIVAGCELFLHGAGPWLPDPVLWGSNEVSAKVEQVRRMAAEIADRRTCHLDHRTPVGLSPRDMGSPPGPRRSASTTAR